MNVAIVMTEPLVVTGTKSLTVSGSEPLTGANAEALTTSGSESLIASVTETEAEDIPSRICFICLENEMIINFTRLKLDHLIFCPCEDSFSKLDNVATSMISITGRV